MVHGKVGIDIYQAADNEEVGIGKLEENAIQKPTTTTEPKADV